MPLYAAMYALDNKFYREIIKAPELVVKYLQDLPEQQQLMLGKSWQILHYGFCGDELEISGDYGMIIMGGRALSDEDDTRILNAQQVAKIAALLKYSDRESFKQLLCSRDLNNVTLYGFDSQNRQACIDEACDKVEKLRDFFTFAAAKKFVVVVLIG